MTDFADLVVTGADVWTADAARSWTDAVAVRGDRIVALGAAHVADLLAKRERHGINVRKRTDRGPNARHRCGLR